MRQRSRTRAAIAAVIAAALVGAASTLALSAQATGSGGNYVTNGDFEGGDASGWVNAAVAGSPQPAVESAAVHSGSYAMTATGVFDLVPSPSVVSAADASSIDWVRADFWAKGVQGTQTEITLDAGFQQTGADGKVVSSDAAQALPYDGTWYHFVTPAFRVSHTSAVDLHISTYAGRTAATDVVDIDDVTVTSMVDDPLCGPQTMTGAAQNSIENCSFEDPYNLYFPTSAWNSGSDATNTTMAVDDTTAHSGSRSMKLTANAAGTVTLNDAPDSRDVKRPNSFPSSLTSCTASAWIKSSGGHGEAKIRLREWDSTNVLVGSNTTTTVPAAGTWQQVSVTYTLDPAAPHHATGSLDLTIWATKQLAGDSLNVDSISETCS